MLATLALCAAGAPAQANPKLLFDANTGVIYQQEDAFKRWYPASLTKLMTAYVAFKALRDGELQLNSPIVISKKASRQQPSKMGYPAGSKMTANNAFTMMLVKSANDVAMAVAENIGGSEARFVARMNSEAKRLGMNDTNFVNPAGLHASNHYSSAHDMALLVTALRRDFPEQMKYFGIEGIIAGKKTFENFNVLVGRYPGTDGMKTGFICASGYNLIGSATRDGRTLVAIVMGEKNLWSRADAAAALLDRGFATPAGGNVTLTSMIRPADTSPEPFNMREIACPKPAPGAKPAEQGENAKTPEIKSKFQLPFDHAPTLVQVGLGGADGPVPAGKLDADGKEFADVPIPAWRPDRPEPVWAAQQGDAAAELRP